MYEPTYEAQHFKRKEAFYIIIVVNTSFGLLTAQIPRRFPDISDTRTRVIYIISTSNAT